MSELADHIRSCAAAVRLVHPFATVHYATDGDSSEIELRLPDGSFFSDAPVPGQITWFPASSHAYRHLVDALDGIPAEERPEVVELIRQVMLELSVLAWVAAEQAFEQVNHPPGLGEPLEELADVAEEAEAAFDGLAELLLANAPAEWRTGDPEADVVTAG